MSRDVNNELANCCIKLVAWQQSWNYISWELGPHTICGDNSYPACANKVPIREQEWSWCEVLIEHTLHFSLWPTQLIMLLGHFNVQMQSQHLTLRNQKMLRCYWHSDQVSARIYLSPWSQKKKLIDLRLMQTVIFHVFWLFLY